MPNRTMLAIMAALSLFSAPARAASDFTTPVTEDFWEEDIEWTGGSGRAYEFRWYATVIKGQIAICGAGKFIDPTNRTASIDVLRKAKVTLDDKLILTDISFFTKLKKADNLMAASATCRNTGAKLTNGANNTGLEMSGRSRF